MLIDKFAEFADAASVAASAGTALIGSQIDLGVARDIGNGRPVYLVITVDTEIITGGSAGTIQFVLASDSTAAIATDGSATEHLYTPIFTTDDAAANSPQLNAGEILFYGAIPGEGAVYERFLGILCVTASNDVTAGKVNAFLTFDPPNNRKTYADAI